MAENKNDGIFWGLLVVLGGAAIWAINKFITPKDSNTPTPTPSPSPTPSTFNYKTFLNGKWKMTYSTPTDKGGVEIGTISGDTYTLEGGEVRKLILMSYDAPTKILTFTEVKADGSTMPEIKVKINETAKTMTGTNGGWDVVFTKVSSSVQTPTSNIVKYKDYYLNTSTKSLFDNNDNLVGDGVDHYDVNTKTIYFTNGYNLNTITGILINQNGIAITQNQNSGKLPLKPADGWGNKALYFPLPKKIYGYSSIDNIFFYNENDTTPYSLLDTYAHWVSVIFFGGGYQGSNVPEKIFTNARVYNAVESPLKNQSKSAYLLAYQTQYSNKQPFLYTFDINSDGFLKFDLFALNYPNVFYDSNGVFRGAGVTKFDKAKQVIYFEDFYFLDLKTNTLYDKSGTSAATNVTNYISTFAMNYGVGLDMNNIGSGRLPAGAMADGVIHTVKSLSDQINYKSNVTTLTTNSIF